MILDDLEEGETPVEVFPTDEAIPDDPDD
jgi:hypothetical protein